MAVLSDFILLYSIGRETFCEGAIKATNCFNQGPLFEFLATCFGRCRSQILSEELLTMTNDNTSVNDVNFLLRHALKGTHTFVWSILKELKFITAPCAFCLVQCKTCPYQAHPFQYHHQLSKLFSPLFFDKKNYTVPDTKVSPFP